MTDRSWMLNAKAIRTAKECINLVKDELQIKLTLSHPEFIEMLHSYVELTDSKPLAEAYTRLISIAGESNVMKALKEQIETDNNIVQILDRPKSKTIIARELQLDDEMVEYHGKFYQRWQNGLEFKGLYRGQARYC